LDENAKGDNALEDKLEQQISQQIIPLVDLKAQRAQLAQEIDQALQGVLSSCDFILGESVGRFEKAFAEYCGTRFAVGCNSGTDALQLALRALDIGPGDEVIVPAMTFVATAMAVSLTGATPVLVDVRSDNALLDTTLVRQAISPNVKAIMPVHLFGQCAEMDELGRIATEAGVYLIEDGAQSHGASDGGKRSGSFGHVGGFSFYPGKNLGAFGDGGAVTTNDAELQEKLTSLRNVGATSKHRHERIGLNSRLDTLQAALLLVKLKYLDDWNARRAELASRYDELLSDIPGIELTRYRPGSVYHLYVIRVHNRDETFARLNDSGIRAGLHYPVAVHQTGAYRDLMYKDGSFPVAEDWAQRCISLPIYPELPEEAIARAAEILRG
jgi:dTDP-4-amino-4,6-dideoxygalactose transaminase